MCANYLGFPHLHIQIKIAFAKSAMREALIIFVVAVFRKALF